MGFEGASPLQTFLNKPLSPGKGRRVIERVVNKNSQTGLRIDEVMILHEGSLALYFTYSLTIGRGSNGS